VVQSAFTLIFADAGGSCLRVLQFPPLFKRFVLAPLTSRSQQQTNKLWEPEPIFVGELYANALKTFAICLVYAPMWPLASLLVPFALLVAYFCFNLAIVYWWSPPPQLSDELLHRMRGWICVVLLLRYAVEAVCDYKARRERDATEAVVRVLVQVALLGLYMIVPLERVHTSLARFRYDDAAPNPSPYETVQDRLPKYECPAAGPTRSAQMLQSSYERSLTQGLKLVAMKPDDELPREGSEEAVSPPPLAKGQSFF